MIGLVCEVVADDEMLLFSAIVDNKKLRRMPTIFLD